MFTVTIHTDNAAFENSETCEVARIMRVIASNLENSETTGVCIDYNGNTVGSFLLERVAI